MGIYKHVMCNLSAMHTSCLLPFLDVKYICICIVIFVERQYRENSEQELPSIEMKPYQTAKFN